MRLHEAAARTHASRKPSAAAMKTRPAGVDALQKRRPQPSRGESARVPASPAYAQRTRAQQTVDV